MMDYIMPYKAIGSRSGAKQRNGSQRLVYSSMMRACEGYSFIFSVPLPPSHFRIPNSHLPKSFYLYGQKYNGMNYIYILATTCCLLLAACGGSTEKDKQENKQSQTTESESAQQNNAAQQGERLYPSVPLDTLQMLFQQCDYVDYVFYYTNFSISQNQQGDIQQAIRHISEAVPVIKPGCKPIGRIFFQVEGENRLEADLYFEQGCTYYVFFQDGKPAYANEIMPAGIQFYNNIFSSVKGQQ